MFIGIDGGGTSTKVEIHRDGQSERRKYGPFNISAIGEEAFRKLLREMFADWGSLEECRAICVGGAGVSCGELEQIIREELRPTGFAGKLLLRSDSEIALRGAVDGPGCILIAGTGSIGFGVNEAGETARAAPDAGRSQSFRVSPSAPSRSCTASGRALRPIRPIRHTVDA